MGGIQATERLTARVPACAHCGLAGTDGIAQRGAQLFPGSFSSSIFTLPKLLLFEHSSGQAQVFLNPCRGETSAHDCKVPSSFSPKSFRSHVLSSYSVGWTGERHPMQALAAFQEEEFYRRVKRHLFSGVSTSTTDDADGRQRETAGSESSRVSSTSVQNERGCSDRPVCQNCGAISKQKFPIFCEDCHTIMKPRYSDAGRNELSYFDLLQIRPDFDVDLRVLDAKYKQLEKRLHPDRHVHAPEEMHEYRDKHRQQIVEAVNTLRCPAKRARHLLECHEGHPCDEVETDRVTDMDLLTEVLELNELLEAVETREQLEGFSKRVSGILKADEEALRTRFSERNFDEVSKLVQRYRMHAQLKNRIKNWEPRPGAQPTAK